MGGSIDFRSFNNQHNCITTNQPLTNKVGRLFKLCVKVISEAIDWESTIAGEAAFEMVLYGLSVTAVTVGCTYGDSDVMGQSYAQVKRECIGFSSSP